ncbi:MAG: hypothetical protein WBX19_21935 [Terracidiphilus sp.]
MQWFRCVAPMTLALLASTGLAQEKPKTDAETDWLRGPVKSVVTVSERPSVKWQQSSGPSMVMPILCHDCEYDPDGTRTLSGDVIDGKFYGSIITLTRDANGRVTKRLVAGTPESSLSHDEIVGPWGKTEETDYQDGKIFARQLIQYDQYGHMSDWLTLDANGIQTGRTSTRSAKDGTMLERTSWIHDGELSYHETYNPETDEQNFTRYDESGNAVLTFKFAHNQVISFWEASDETPQFGQGFTSDVGENDRDTFQCTSTSQCVRSRVHFEYAGPGKLNPTTAEWRDASGNLTLGAYCKYEFDEFQNWTKRTVQVWSPDLRQRTLYETDTRTITYWSK